MFRSVFIFTIIAILSGCSAHFYNGEKRSTSELAYITENIDEVRIQEIDGKKAKRIKYINLPSNTYVLPGKHRISVKYHYVTYYAYGAKSTSISDFSELVCFNAEPGKQYVVRSNPRGEIYIKEFSWTHGEIIDLTSC